MGILSAIQRLDQSSIEVINRLEYWEKTYPRTLKARKRMMQRKKVADPLRNTFASSTTTKTKVNIGIRVTT